MSQLEPSAGPRRNLRGAWWVMVVVLAFFVLVAIVQVGRVVNHLDRPVVGDGKDPATYGFDLSTLTIDDRWLAAAMPRDALPALDRPALLNIAQVDSLNRAERGKYLVSEDLVIGVVVGAEARAYPLRMMHWHEVANDTVGGRPLAVCWHPLSGSAVVLEGPMQWSVSGLMWNSHHLIHDFAGSLWVPLLAEAVAGPAAGQTLPVIPSALVTWGEWRTAHPLTRVPYPEPEHRAAYKRDPFGNYASGETIRYPVKPLPTLTEGTHLKDSLAVDSTEQGGLPFARLHAYRFALQALGLI